MREIKFRAWDGKLMLPVENICFDTKTVEVLIPCDAVGCEGHPIEYDFGNVALMQYTGLKDKNGTEIYEGDIVRCYGGTYWNGICEYNYVIEVKDIRDLNEIVHSENVEIIGNKYENPELLGGRE